MGGPQYQRLHSNNIGKTGSKLGDGFQKHLQDLERMNEMMTQSQLLTVSTFQIIPAKTTQSAGFFFGQLPKSRTKIYLANQQT